MENDTYWLLLLIYLHYSVRFWRQIQTFNTLRSLVG